MDISKYKLWTEVDWAEQFRKEDINLNAYFEELEKYLDLPDEDELVFAGLKKRKLSTDELNIREELGDYSYEDEDLEISDSELMNNSESSAFYFDMGKISSELCMDMGFSEQVDFQDLLTFMMVSGRAMSLYMDFLQLGKDDFPELKKAILKREISMINILVGLLGRIQNYLGFEKTETYISRLHVLRENLIDLRFAV